MKAAQYAAAARTRIWLDLPSGGGTDALRGALMAMGLIPQPLPHDPLPRGQGLATSAMASPRPTALLRRQQNGRAPDAQTAPLA
ncbi:MAG: hypothetical protein MUF08_03895 [Burkholderiaceae bacterium]|jgi:hypothetical protein|nr:hypothetical protein [Burkholderiaceae bacterium]